MNSMAKMDCGSNSEWMTHGGYRGVWCSRPTLWLLLAGVLGVSSGCSSGDNKSDDTNQASGFEECIASLTLCKTSEMDTAAEMENSCKSTEFLPIPLTDGTSHGPVTIDGGPYGAKIEWNEGAGTEFVNEVNPSEPSCFGPGGTIDAFGEPSELTDDLKNTRDLDYSLYTIFRPACMKDGETYPVITWANGTCGLTHGYALLLGTVASYGYVVIASNSTWTGTAPTDHVQTRALDYAKALNEDSNSIFYQHLDMDKIGAMGHSQGALATLNAASDPRVKAIIAWNRGPSNEKPFLTVSGERDIGDPGTAGMETETNAATQPGAWVYYHQVLQTGGGLTGHLVLMEEPERVWELAVSWWDWQLKGEQEAKAMFVGDNCGFCNKDAEFSYGHNSVLQ